MPDGSTGAHDASAEVAAATDLLMTRPARLGRVRLGVVDGPSGSGKSTLAEAWTARIRAAGLRPTLFSSDSLATWTDPFGWWPRLESGLLGPLSAELAGRIRLTDWSAGPPRPGRWLDVDVPDVLILEGVSCGRAAITGRASVLVWVEVPDRAARLERSVARDGEASRAHLAAWQDEEDRFFAADGTRGRADLLVHPP